LARRVGAADVKAMRRALAALIAIRREDTGIT
jgi:hypothetical protein